MTINQLVDSALVFCNVSENLQCIFVAAFLRLLHYIRKINIFSAPVHFYMASKLKVKKKDIFRAQNSRRRCADILSVPLSYDEESLFLLCCRTETELDAIFFTLSTSILNYFLQQIRLYFPLIEQVCVLLLKYFSDHCKILMFLINTPSKDNTDTQKSNV